MYVHVHGILVLWLGVQYVHGILVLGVCTCTWYPGIMVRCTVCTWYPGIGCMYMYMGVECTLYLQCSWLFPFAQFALLLWLSVVFCILTYLCVFVLGTSIMCMYYWNIHVHIIRLDMIVHVDTLN